jgi:hypothetical protein
MDEGPNLNSGTPWCPLDDGDIRNGLDHGQTIEEAPNFLCRTQSEIRQRLADIEDADAICDGFVLKDKTPHRDRVSLQTYRDARAAIP